MSSAIKWQAPPEPKGGRGGTKWKDLTDALRSRPGEWALLLEDVGVGNAAMFKKRFPGFEFTSRCVDGQKHADIYGRYLGDES